MYSNRRDADMERESRKPDIKIDEPRNDDDLKMIIQHFIEIAFSNQDPKFHKGHTQND